MTFIYRYKKTGKYLTSNEEIKDDDHEYKVGLMRSDVNINLLESYLDQIATNDGWKDLHGSRDRGGAYLRGINPTTNKMESVM